MQKNLAIILTARMNSERLPGKAMLEIQGQPLIGWIVQRLKRVGNVVLATTELTADDALASYARVLDVPVYRGATNDVITRMDNALKKYQPKAEWVLRGLGDCPFMAGELIERAVDVCTQQGADVMAWALPPQTQPLYGSREFPYSRSAWDRIVANSMTREHVDVYYHCNRDLFKVLYHEPPPSFYFRQYRVEVDWPEDIAMLRKLSQYVSPLAMVKKLVSVMDKHPEVTMLNRERVERTGPSTYSYETLRSWYADMRGKAIMGWDDSLWGQVEGGEPVFCEGGTCLLGFARGGTLQTRTGDLIRGDARITCACGVGKRWNAAS